MAAGSIVGPGRQIAFSGTVQVEMGNLGRVNVTFRETRQMTLVATAAPEAGVMEFSPAGAVRLSIPLTREQRPRGVAAFCDR